jgi:two-component SAPR family response regulator
MAVRRRQRAMNISILCVLSRSPITARSLAKGAYALRRIEGDTAHFLMVTFWESEDAVRAIAGDDISVAKHYDFDKSFLLELEPTSSHYETYDR